MFSLPRNLILSEDRPQIDNPCSEEQMQAIDRQLKEGKDKLMAVSLTGLFGPKHEILVLIACAQNLLNPLLHNNAFWRL